MQKSWKDSFKVYAKKSSWVMLFLGFSSGLPASLVYGPLSIWLTEAGVDRSKITQFSWIAFCFTFKFLWAPLVDQLKLPVLTNWMGRRRSWLLVGQIGAVAGLVGMAFTDPSMGLQKMVWFTLLLAFFSATQDIVIDAFRIESSNQDDQAALITTYMFGYRIAMIVAGVGCLAIAQMYDPNPDPKAYDYMPWQIAYLAMAACMLFGLVTTLFIKEPQVVAAQPYDYRNAKTPFAKAGVWIFNAMVMPIWDFVKTYKWPAVLILLLIGVYRISDIVLGTAAYPFYTELGFQKLEIGAISKFWGIIAVLAGSFIAGILQPRLGTMRMLFLGAILAAVSNLLFVLMASRGHDISFLTLVICADNIAVGIASTAFIAYMSGLTNVSYTATQYALFSSIMPLVPRLLGGFSGAMVNEMGYAKFFVFTTLLGIPVLLLIGLAAKFAPTKTQVPLQKAS